MPSSVLSHQGVVLPLKTKYPKKFDGTALCVGSFAPDLDFLFSYFFKDPRSIYYLFHSIGGFIYTIPLSLFLVIFFDKVLTPHMAFLATKKPLGLLSRSLTFFGLDEYHVLKRKKISLRWFVKAFYSVLVGTLSHFLLDLPTHGQIPYLNPFYHESMPEWFLHEYFRVDVPFYEIVEITNYTLLWFLFSIVFGILALYNIRHIKKRQLLQKWYKT